MNAEQAWSGGGGGGGGGRGGGGGSDNSKFLIREISLPGLYIEIKSGNEFKLKALHFNLTL